MFNILARKTAVVTGDEEFAAAFRPLQWLWGFFLTFRTILFVKMM